jgi:hypothetical protein
VEIASGVSKTKAPRTHRVTGRPSNSILPDTVRLFDSKLGLVYPFVNGSSVLRCSLLVLRNGTLVRGASCSRNVPRPGLRCQTTKLTFHKRPRRANTTTISNTKPNPPLG